MNSSTNFGVFLFLSYFLIFGAFAQDLRYTNSKVMDKLEILDQGKFGTCYAFTSGFLIDYNRFSNKPNLSSRVSPYSVANSYAKSSEVHSATNGGYVCDAVKASIQSKHLKAYAQSDSDAEYDKVGLAFHSAIVLKVMMNYAPLKVGSLKFPIMTKVQYNSKTLRSVEQENLFKNFNKTYEEFKSVMSNTYFVPGLYRPTNEEAFFAVQGTSVTNTWGSLAQTFVGLILEKTVSGSVTVPQVSCLDTKNPQLFENKIKSELASNRPLGISFCSAIITNSNFRSDNNQKKENCAPHAVALIGYEDVGGKGNYLIRNSWGKNFNYDKKWRYDNGDIWISGSSLLNNIFFVHSVK